MLGICPSSCQAIPNWTEVDCIGLVKTATVGRPMVHLGRVVLPGGKGGQHGVFTFDEKSGCQLLTFVWSDRNRRHFISMRSSLPVASGALVEHTQWKQVDTMRNANPDGKDITI